MTSYICTVCGEIYDEEKEGVKFSDLSDDWVCPKCKKWLSAIQYEKYLKKQGA